MQLEYLMNGKKNRIKKSIKLIKKREIFKLLLISNGAKGGKQKKDPANCLLSIDVDEFW